jgi:ATP-dependent protease ClpP protease subunit
MSLSPKKIFAGIMKFCCDIIIYVILIQGISANHSQPTLITFGNDPTVGYIYGKIAQYATDEIIPNDVEILILNSQGGNVGAAVNLRNQIIDRKISTYVSENGICVSACTMVYGAGNYRMAEKSSMFGFHSPSYGADLSTESDTNGVINKIKNDVVVYVRKQYTEMMLEDGLSNEFIQRWINKKEVSFYTAEQMFKLGFVDEVLEEDK